MNWQIVRLLYTKEMRMLLRDRRMVVLSVIIPVVFMPLMLYASKFSRDLTARARLETTYRYAITGSWAAEARSILQKALSADSPEARALKSQEVHTPDPAAALRSNDLHIYIEALSGPEADELLAREKAESDEKKKEQESETAEDQPPNPRRVEPPKRAGGTPLVRIHYMGNRDSSTRGRNQFRTLLTAARHDAAGLLLKEHGFPVDSQSVFALDTDNIASNAEVTGSTIGRFLTLFVVALLLTGGATAAMDIIAGEKERGTLETLLTTAAGRGEIVAAKQLLIISVGLFITVLQVLNLLFYLTLKLIELPPDFVIDVPPASLFALALLFIPMAAFVSSVLLTLSGYAKSYKEAQMNFFPVYMVSIIPSLASLLPGVSLRSAIVLVPLANVSVATREILVGRLDWPMILVASAVMAATAAIMVRVSARTLSNERLITATQFDAVELDPSHSPFARDVFKWYAVLWALLLGTAIAVPQLATLRRQLLFNQFVLFLLPMALMIWRYRLNAREALALRPVRPQVWPVIVMLVPSGALVANGLAQLATRVLPVPREALEQFGRTIFPASIPTWQLLLLIAVIPGIVEELAFRGMLLYGIRRRFRPLMLPLVIGAVFGFFHVSLFRLVGTGVLGVVLTAIVLLTGSIFPAMLFHAANNAMAVLIVRNEFALGYDPWLMVSAVAIFALGFYLLYRNRTPYPLR